MAKVSRPYMDAKEIAEIMDCSERYGYSIIQKLNKELESQGYVIRPGRILRQYFEERTGQRRQEAG